MTPRFSFGAEIEFREEWAGRTWEVRPVVVVADSPELIALFTPPDRPALAALSAGGSRMRLPVGEWELGAVKTFEFPVLGLHVPGTAHSVLLIWEPDWSLRQWYINLESDLRRTADGFECEDHVLDVVVAPDLSTWRWKDEDELEEALARGLFTSEQAAEFRAEGQRAIEWLQARRPPLDRDWASWRPPTGWA
jgi:hypothetical protein